MWNIYINTVFSWPCNKLKKYIISILIMTIFIKLYYVTILAQKMYFCHF